MGSHCLLATGVARYQGTTEKIRNKKFLEPSDQTTGLMQNNLSSDLEARVRQQLVIIQHSLSKARSLQTPPMEQVSANNNFTCEFCDREFSNSPSLHFHMESHISVDPDAPFRCDVCGKCFAVPTELTKHYGTHKHEPSNTDPHKHYQCSICKRAFEHSGKLHRHMRIHTGERPHQCHLCNKTFIQSGQLVIHMRTHTGDKPYVCTTCDKGFTCSKQLKVHMRTHTKEKPYSCDICGKSFGYNHVLKLHQMSHFGEKVYKCTICRSSFSSKKHLESHIKSHDESVLLDLSRTRNMQSPTRPSSVGSSCSDSSTSDKENSTYYKPSYSSLYPSPLTLGVTPTPLAPMAHTNSSPRGPLDTQFLLPSINTICPGDVLTTPHRLASRSTRVARRQKISPLRNNPLYPVTPTLVKTLLEEDLATYGPPTPLRTPSLSPEIYGGCLVTPSSSSEPSLTPPPSVSPPTSISMMTESSLPLRKRRMALSECSDSEDLVIKQECPTDLSGSRGSVICFAN